MNQPLHLKYRPQTLTELVGQDIVRTTLTNALTSKQIAPAYLFTGPRGTGKTSSARILAKSLNCLKSDAPTPTPCGQCAACRSIDKGSSLDVSEIDAASHNGVDDARALIEHSSFAPAQGRYRVFIIDECHALTSNAQNALLKVTEEAGGSKVVFIFCTTEAHKVLPTIISRCQTFNFQALSTTIIINHLNSIAMQERIKIDGEALNAIARTVDGGLRDALQLLSQLRLLEEAITPAHVIEVSGGISESELVSMVNNLVTGDTLATLQTTRHLIDTGKSPQLILTSLLKVYRDLLLVKSTSVCESLITVAISYRKLRLLAYKISFDYLDGALTQLHKSQQQLRTSINASIWLEVCLLNLIPQLRTTNSCGHNGSDSNGHQHSSTRNNSQRSKPGTEGRRKSWGSKTNQIDNQQVWAKVVETAKPTNRGFLSHAELVQLDEQKATLAVQAAYLDKYKRHKKSIERILSKALSYSVTVVIQEQN